MKTKRQIQNRISELQDLQERVNFREQDFIDRLIEELDWVKE